MWVWISVHFTDSAPCERRAAQLSFLCVAVGPGALQCRYIWDGHTWSSLAGWSLSLGSRTTWLCSFPRCHTCMWHATWWEHAGFESEHSMVNLFFITSHCKFFSLYYLRTVLCILLTVISFLINLEKWKLTIFHVNVISNLMKRNFKFHVVKLFILQDKN